MAPSFADFAAARHILLTTFTKDGQPKSVPVWVAAEGDELLVTVGESAWKVKRIRRNPHVRLAICDMRGNVKSDSVDGTAVVVDDPAAVAKIRSAVSRRYGLLGRMAFAFLDARRKSGSLGISITLGTPEQPT